MTNYTEQLKRYWKSENLSFIALFSKYKEKEGFFNDFTNPISRKKLFYPELDNIKIDQKKVSFYCPNASKFIDGHYYKVDLDFTDNPKSKNTPYSLGIKKITPLDQTVIKNHLEGSSNEELLKKVFYLKSFIEKDASKEHIRLRFERLNNPEANKIIANLMREIGKGMYSSKQRMIFELLQNADDAPGKEKVEFHIDTNGDYFFVMHDGAPFSKDDVEAITSAAESTKRKDKKKTGYKGIGFKSAFTDSTEVWLKSSGYQFAFIRESPLFDDFESFYFTTSDYQKYPGLIADHRKKYQKDIATYDSSTDIPWQVIPIWQDNLPSEFTDSNFNNFNNPVQFALKVGTTNIYTDDGYLAAIDNIVKRPQFLLFLRNTSKFRSPKNKVTVTRTDNGHLINIEKSTVEYIGNEGIQKQDILEYTKQIYSDIKVTNDAFSTLNIGLRKIVEKNDLNEDTYHFVDVDDNKIETIPPKLASATETEISFGISLVDNKISPEKEYTKRLPKYSSLFTYLPMEDTRFQLPFLVNADFVPSSDRQRIQGDNLWNKYIMIKVSEKHVDTLAFYATEFIENNSVNGSYLSLLLINLLPEDDTAQQIIESYNHQYLEQLEIQEIVVNDNNETQLLSETILDNSGLIELFGQNIFYEIIDTDKRLPHSNLDASYLKNYEYLDVEIIDLEELAEKITPEICESLGEVIAKKSLYDKPELLKWLNKLVNHIPDDFGKIPFIVHNNALFSLERLVAEDDAWLINKKTLEYEELIKSLGYNTINLNLADYLNINSYLLTFNGYINDKNLAYDRISVNSNLCNLPVLTKIKLIEFLQKSDFMVGVGETKYFGELELFADENGNARPLRKLISRQEEIEAISINQFRVTKNEYSSFSDALEQELIAKDEVFTSFILNTELFNEWSQQFSSENIDKYVNDLKTIYTWVENKDEISSADWASIPWLFVNDESRFLSADKIYWSNEFNKRQPKDYEIIKAILQQTKIKTLPLQACGEIIQKFELKTDDSSGIGWTEINNLETIPANILLDWMENDGSFSDFFEKYTLKLNENSLWYISEIEDIQIFDGSNKELTTYILSNGGLNPLFAQLDKTLCSENRSKIGLLQDDKLLKAIIDSGTYNQELAVFLPTNIPWEILDKFILNLPVFNLKTGTEYNSNSPEHIIIQNLLRTVEDSNTIPGEVLNTIEELRNKIKIDQALLSSFDTSNTISFGKGKVAKGLNLSDVLNEYEGESDVLYNLIEAFVSITNRRKLKQLIFKTILLKPQEIHYKIEEEASTYYSVHQVVFQLLDKSHGGQRNWSKQHFDDYYKSQRDDAQLQSSYQSFLDIIFDLDFTELNGFTFHDLKLKNCVDKNWAIKLEVLPQWILEWIELEQNERTKFISKLGYNGIESPIVKLRKAAISDNYAPNVVTRYLEESKLNMQITWNTIKWLSNFSSQIITRNAELIKQINNFVNLSSNNLNSVTIPIIEAIGNDGVRLYNLKSMDTNSHLYLLPEDEEFDASIFTAIKQDDAKTLFIDSSCGNKSKYFDTTIVETTESIDKELLEKDSKLWEEAFYKKWEHYSEYPIYIFKGNEIPYLRSFNGISINKFTNDLKVANDGKFYVSNILKNNLLSNLPSSFPNNMLTQLTEWHYKTLQNESLLDEDSFDYKEDIDRLLQDRLGISEEDQKRESGNAKTHAVYFLDESGFDVSKVNDAGAALTSITDPDENKVDCIVRSAKGGLLYLDKEHWDMLDDDNMYLIVIYPGNSPRMFKNRLELLEEELAENVLFRIPNNKNTNEIDGVFKALESEPHVILVTSEKMKENLFSKLKPKRDFNKEENAALGGDNFTI